MEDGLGTLQNQTDGPELTGCPDLYGLLGCRTTACNCHQAGTPLGCPIHAIYTQGTAATREGAMEEYNA
jgi:hypothetical protein